MNVLRVGFIVWCVVMMVGYLNVGRPEIGAGWAIAVAVLFGAIKK